MAAEKKNVFALLESEDSHEPMSERADDDDDITRLLPLVIGQALIGRVPGNRINGYFEVVIPNYNDWEFKSHFRLGRESWNMELLCQKLSTSELLTKKNKGGRTLIPLGKQAVIFLWYCSTKEPHRTAADRFDVTRSSVVRVVSRVCQPILDQLHDQIKWSCGVLQKEVVSEFKSFNNMDNVIGAIDGCHIPISGRDENNEVFINRKQFPSLVLQACCDS